MVKSRPRWLTAVFTLFRLLILGVSLGALAGCTNGPCRPLKHPELAAQQEGKAKSAMPTGDANTPAPNSASPTTGREGTILVYKADGSLQCGMGKGLTPAEMEKQLEGIKVFSRDRRSDGLMHIQICGHPTGMINVFEISAASLKDAESKGFKKLEPRS
jgi:hypothetical protein